MGFQEFFNATNEDSADDAEPADIEQMINRIARLVEETPELALFGVSIIAELEQHHLTPYQAQSYLKQAERIMGE